MTTLALMRAAMLIATLCNILAVVWLIRRDRAHRARSGPVRAARVNPGELPLQTNFPLPPGAQIDLGPTYCPCPWCGRQIVRYFRITPKGSTEHDDPPTTLH